ncbi:CAP domain-containing protein [Clostridium nigeriense]|uniref:CAP domain-containing protein n=1 Tax=Clostridium nigeriense TaxID=1805470 RepID=UPI00082AB491|nr:CAP domain-containing protein [Clostridium nigeriense]
MIKSKLLTLLVSTGLTIALGVGSFFLPSKNQVVTNENAKVQTNSEVTSSNEEVNKAESNKPQDSNKNSVSVNDKASNTVGNVSNSNSDNKNANNEVSKNNTEGSEASEQCDDNGFVIQQPSNNGSTNTPQQGNGTVETPSTTPQAPSSTDESNYIAEIEQAIFQRVNKERAAAGLPALSYNTTMEHYARVKSKDMGDRGYFDHKDPQGRLITEQMKADGVSYNAWGENIAYIQGVNGNSTLATQFMDNWMNSPGHRANILSSNFSSIGIGVYKIGNTYYATQEFYR